MRQKPHGLAATAVQPTRVFCCLRGRAGLASRRCGAGARVHAQFADEWNEQSLALRHDGPGVLSMANSGPNSYDKWFALHASGAAVAEWLLRGCV